MFEAEIRTVDGEGALYSYWTEEGTPVDPPKPLGLGNRSVGGGDFNTLTPGPSDGAGLNNVGLLVWSCGRVTASDSAALYVDDGSNLDDGSGNAGVRVEGLSGYRPYRYAVGTISRFQAYPVCERSEASWRASFVSPIRRTCSCCRQPARRKDSRSIRQAAGRSRAIGGQLLGPLATTSIVERSRHSRITRTLTGSAAGNWSTFASIRPSGRILRQTTSRHPARTLPGTDVQSYGHNGFFKSIKEIVHFYNTRDVGDWPPPEVEENLKTRTNSVTLG